MSIVTNAQQAWLVLRGKATIAGNDTFGVKGLIRIREIPFETEEEYRYWWLPEVDRRGKVIRAARMSEREKAKYTAQEAENLITTAGRTQILNYMGNPTSNSTVAFGQYFAVGTFPIISVAPGDTSVNGEIYRAVPSSYTVTGNTVDLSTFFGTSVANGTLTSCGIVGGSGASGTIGSGTLYSHALLNNYSKLNTQTVTIDYLLALN